MAIEIDDFVTCFLVEFTPEIVVPKVPNNLSQTWVCRGALVNLSSLLLVLFEDIDNEWKAFVPVNNIFNFREVANFS